MWVNRLYFDRCVFRYFSFLIIIKKVSLWRRHAVLNKIEFERIVSETLKAYSHDHEVTNETSNDKAAQRETRRQFIHTATSACRNVDESYRCF